MKIMLALVSAVALVSAQPVVENTDDLETIANNYLSK